MNYKEIRYQLKVAETEQRKCEDEASQLKEKTMQLLTDLYRAIVKEAKSNPRYKVVTGHSFSDSEYAYLAVSADLKARISRAEYVEKGDWYPDDMDTWIEEGLRISFVPEEDKGQQPYLIQADGIVFGCGCSEDEAWHDLGENYLKL